jgi:hypothetical protein
MAVITSKTTGYTLRPRTVELIDSNPVRVEIDDMLTVVEDYVMFRKPVKGLEIQHPNVLWAKGDVRGYHGEFFMLKDGYNIAIGYFIKNRNEL